jgi:hypothetical protein
MGYSTSRRAVRKVLSHLDRLVVSRKEVSWASNEPGRLAYRLREAFHAAKFYDDFTKYSKLNERWVIRVTEGRVVAAPVEIKEVITAGEKSISHGEKPTTIVDDVISLHAIIGYMIQSENLIEVYFPNAGLMEADLHRLNRWAMGSAYTLISHEQGGLTLTTLPVPEGLAFG